nr:hypothetical protein [Tanacetum cinerariifolium]
MYVIETETDTYAISRVLAPMPIIICVAEMSFKREDAVLGNWEHLSMTLFRRPYKLLMIPDCSPVRTLEV